MFKIPKNDSKFHWTNHVIEKMKFYGLSPQKVKNVLVRPKRKEVGIAENIIAVMQPTGAKKRPTEIWVMYQKISQKLKRKTQNKKIIIISAWRYPGKSPIRQPIPIPLEIENELKSVLKEFSF